MLCLLQGIYKRSHKKKTLKNQQNARSQPRLSGPSIPWSEPPTSSFRPSSDQRCCRLVFASYCLDRTRDVEDLDSGMQLYMLGLLSRDKVGKQVVLVAHE